MIQVLGEYYCPSDDSYLQKFEEGDEENKLYNVMFPYMPCCHQNWMCGMMGGYCLKKDFADRCDNRESGEYLCSDGDCVCCLSK